MGRSATHKSPIFPESGELRRKKAEISPPLPSAPSSVSHTVGGFGTKVTKEEQTNCRIPHSAEMWRRCGSVWLGSVRCRSSGAEFPLFFSGLLFLFHFIPFLAFVYIFHALVALPWLAAEGRRGKGALFWFEGKVNQQPFGARVWIDLPGTPLEGLLSRPERPDIW